MAAVNGDILAKTVMKSLKVVEDRMDAEASALDAQIRSLDLDVDSLRDKRKEYLKHIASKNQEYLASGHGTYEEVTDTKAFFNLCKKSERVIVHFYRSTTKRCEILDKHLGLLSRKHIETRFLRVNVEKHQFLCERLRIYVLPSLVVIINGKTEKTFRGFEEFGNSDDFRTWQLEERLKDSGGVTTLLFTNPDCSEKTTNPLQEAYNLDSDDEIDVESKNKEKIRQSSNCKDIDSDDDW